MIDRLKEFFFSKGVLVRRLNVPYSKPQAIIEISNLCNASCVFCPYESIKKFSDKQFTNMSIEDSRKVINIIKQLDIEVVNFTPTSGDLFINKDWFEILSIALNQENIKEVLFNTNAILLNKENIEKLLALPNLHKLRYIAISLGGLDAETYRKLFKVDKFDKVAANVNLLLKSLKDHHSSVKVIPNLHYMKNSRFSKKDVDRIYNQARYQHFESSDATRSKTYYKIRDVEEYEELEFPESPYNKREVCLRMRYFRFAANGDVWLCGCVASETKESNSLRVGTLEDTLENLKARQAHLVNEWFSYGHVPDVCTSCSVYRPY